MFISKRVLHFVLFLQGENAVTLPRSAQRKNAFLGEIKQMSKSNQITPRKEVDLVLLHHILGHSSTRSLIDGDTDTVWKDIELRIDQDSFYSSC